MKMGGVSFMDMPLYIFPERVLRSSMNKSYYDEKSVI